MWTLILKVIELFYTLSVIGLTAYGIHNLLLVILYWRRKNPPNPLRLASDANQSDRDWPAVTIQLPLYNERYIVERLLDSVVKLDYPRQKIQIQILDDSTDSTAKMVNRLVQHYHDQGIQLQLIRRSNRQGYKAGALSEGLNTATGDLIAVFDADFIPPTDWLKRTVPAFDDLKLGCLQTRWGHLNQNLSPLTRAEALALDGHFIVEHTARSRNSLFLNFNGTAGLWRKKTIADAGGWASDTLTEDLDLSYRAQMRGWKIGYLPDIVVPGELPAQLEAFKHQQFRWAKGTVQTIKKLLPTFLSADLPWKVRLFGLGHLCAYFASPLMLGMFLFLLPIGYFTPSFLHQVPSLPFAAFGPPLLYLFAKTDNNPRLIDRLRSLPLLILLGFGLTLNNTIAVYEGFSRKGGDFVRTPKYNLVGGKGNWNTNAYNFPLSPMVIGELALAAYAILSVILLIPKAGWGITPWLFVFAAGNLYMMGANLWQHQDMTKARSRLNPTMAT